ncbi:MULTISPECIES: GNAT family N-acetyltransferase [unclassified Dietzia]|uniref:GNAT family N-acetyltransferase n=1 Tax=unclassified Dietzia TaxID=2617939 RepID=UPI000D20A22B|nr:hypothetical protein CT688_13295 [Dietzia sp. JS16-p6b]
MKLEIVTAEANEAVLARIVDLHNEVWPRESVGREQKAKWAFGGNPLGRAPLVVAVGENGEFLGVRGGMFWSVDLGSGEVIRAIQLHGTAVHPSVRRQGLFSRMTVKFLEEVDRENVPVVFNVSVAASRAGYEKLGWNYSTTLRSMVLPVRLGRAIRQMIGGRIQPRTPGESRLTRRPDFEDVRGLLLKRASKCVGSMHTVYTHEFFEWRFASDIYQWFGNPTDGYVVYRLRQRGNLLELLIGDVWPGSASVKSLVRSVIMREKPDLVVSWTSTVHPNYRPLRRMGFIVQPRRSLNLGLRFPVAGTGLINCGLMAADIDTF